MSTTFLRRLAAFACAALVSTPFAAPSAGQTARPSAQQGPAPVRLALVGAWHVHTSGFLNRIAQMNPGQVEWMAVWDQDASRGRQFAERLGVVYQPDYQTILDDPRVDAVMIEAETNLHLDLILRAAQARKHIFTDKILTPRVADALRIRDAVDRAGVKFVISHESMPVGSYQYARRLVTEGRLGEIVSVHFRRAHGMAKGNGLPASWWDPAVAGGGALIDLGVHGMGLLTYLAGPPARVTASMRHRTGRTLEDSATILVDFENGAIGTAHTNMVTNTQENLLEVVGTDGMLVVVGTEGRETVYLNSKHIPERSKGMTVVPPAEYAGDGKYPINKFIDFVRDRANAAQYLTGSGLDIETALRVVAISEAAYESARRDGQPQAVPGIPRATTPAPGPSATGDLPAARTPLQALPPYMRLLTDWGVRPEWSRDGASILFMERGLGDAYRLDVATGRLTPLTAHFYNQGFDRVLPLTNGDYLLTGPRAVDPADPWSGRHTRFEMFVLDGSLTRPPVPLGELIDEGPAVSRTRPHVAWTAPGQREMYEADIVYEAGVPRLANKRLVLSYGDRPVTERLETQDFRPPDERELLFSCYSGTAEEPFYFSDVCGIDLATGRITNYTKTPEQYDEAESVFPDGRFAMVESDRHGTNRQWKIDVYRVALDGSNRAERVTFFQSGNTPYHGSNPVVSPDGKWAAVQLGIHGMGAGQGRGLVLVDLAAWERHRREGRLKPPPAEGEAVRPSGR